MVDEIMVGDMKDGTLYVFGESTIEIIPPEPLDKNHPFERPLFNPKEVNRFCKCMKEAGKV